MKLARTSAVLENLENAIEIVLENDFLKKWKPGFFRKWGRQKGGKLIFVVSMNVVFLCVLA